MTDKLEATLAERGSNYGAFSGHAAITQHLKGVIRASLVQNTKFTSLDAVRQAVVLEAAEMIAHKLGRIVNGDPLFADSWQDIAGYATLVPRFAPAVPPESPSAIYGGQD